MDLSGVDVLSVLVFWTSLSELNKLVIATEPYQCYGTVCNGGVVEEFCQRNFPYCRPCSDVNNDCETTHFPQNCTRYCVDYLVGQALDKDTPVSCPCPPKLRNGQWQIEQENGCPLEGVHATTHAEFVCHTGFQTVGVSSWRCSFNGTWLSDETGTDHTFPFCSETASSLPLIYAVGILSVICVCLINKQVVDYVRANHHKQTSKECADVESQIQKPLLEREKEQVHEIQEQEESETRDSVSQDAADQPKDTSRNENNDENVQDTEPRTNDSPASQSSVNVHITLNIEGRGEKEDTIESDDTSSNEPDDTLLKELEDSSSYRPADVCSKPIQETGEVETKPKDKLMQLSNAVVANIPRLSPTAPSESTVFS